MSVGYDEPIGYDEPNVGYNGEPEGWTPTVAMSNWGRLRVTAWTPGGSQTDVTFLRDVPVEVVSWSSADPFGDERMVLRFPQITALDTFGTGNLAWLVKWANIDLQRVHTDGTTTTTLWEGLIASWTLDHTSDGCALTVECLGAIYQLGLYRRAPGLSDSADAIDAVFVVQFDSLNSKPALRTLPLTVQGGPTGITTRTKGAWQSTLEYVSEELAKATTNSGNDQWTILLDRPRQPVLKLRDRTTVHWTVTAGQPGFDISVGQDWSMAANVIYAESQDEAGSTVRNLVLGSSGNALFHPFAFETDVHSWSLNESTGVLNTSATTITTSKVRIERYLNAGEAINRTELKSLAEEYLQREKDPGWYGTARLRVGPQEAAHFGMRAGENLKVKYFNGTGAGGTLFHLARVEFSRTDTSYEASLTLDTKARDFLAIEELLRRNKGATSPARRLRAGYTSGLVEDKIVPWDGKTSGWYPTARAWDGTSTVSLTANTWSVTKIVMAGGPLTIVKSEFYASAATQFGVYVFDWNINTANLPSNPFADGAWDNPPAGFIVGWGGFGQRAGYSPGLESEADTVTGVLLDEGTWDIPPRRGTASSVAGDSSNAAMPPFLYVAVYAVSSCTMRGRFYHGG